MLRPDAAACWRRKRLLFAGADAYVLADSVEELANKIGSGHPQPAESERATAGELTAGTTVDELITAFLRESIEYSTRAHAHTSVPEQRDP